MFVGWSGVCSGAGLCTTTMSAARSVTATFLLIHFQPDGALKLSSSSMFLGRDIYNATGRNQTVLAKASKKDAIQAGVKVT
jgi:hypothetical protein